MAKKDDDKNKMFTLPEARVIHHSLFVKDQYNDKSVPAYKIELAFPKGTQEADDLLDMLLDFAVDTWGEGADEDEYLVLPLLDGDKLARKREKKGKDGAAYKDMWVVRASTIYNKDGVDGPGGIQVYDEDVELISAAQSAQVYPGCFGEAAVVIGTYQGDDAGPDKDEPFNGLKFYLSAFQKTADGERLATGGDRSGLFKPRKKAPGRAAGETRRRRRNRDDD